MSLCIFIDWNIIMTILDFQELTKKISHDQPAGSDLRADNSPNYLYQKIKDARSQARHVERQQLQNSADTTNQKADWLTVYKLATEILTIHSKDLEICSWLIEALLREYSFAGLAAGFCLTRQLIEKFWDELYPTPDEDGLITRLMPLTGLNGEETDGTLIVPIALIELTEGRSQGPFSLWQYQQAAEVNRIADTEKRNQRINAGAVTLESIMLAASETSSQFFQKLLCDLQNCIDEFTKLNNVLNEKCGEYAPPSSRIQTQLNNCLDCIKTISQGILESSLVETKVNSSEELATLSKESINPSSREKVLQSLLQAADYFRQTEPHSPISYLLDRSVRWARMPLHELLKEIITDEQARMSLCSLTGVKA